MKIVYKIIIIFIIIILSVIGIFSIKYNRKEEIVERNNNIDKKEYVYFEDMNELGLYLAEKNGDWSKYDLSDNLLKKYNEKDGIFGKLEFDKVEYKPYHNGKYPFEEYSYLVLTKGKRKTAYLFAIISKLDGLDISININDAISLTNDNGEDIYVGSAINKANFNSCMHKLAWGYEQEGMVAKTPNFQKKYPHFLDLFIHYSPLEFNQITYIENKSSYDERVAYFEVDSILECKKREYKVKFELDKGNFLDEVRIELIDEIIFDGSSQNTGNKLFYKNSSWDKINVTEKFKANHKEPRSIFPDIDEIDNNFNFCDDEYVAYTIIPHEKSICGFKWKDGKFRYYIKKSKLDKNNCFDECLYEKLPYENMTMEEVRELYLDNIQ